MTEQDRAEMADILRAIVDRGERIECERHGHALTADEARVVKAAHFVRQIAPYVFQPKKGEEG